MGMLTNIDDTWETLVVAAAGEIANDETTSNPSTNNTLEIAGVDEVTVRPKAFDLDTATSIDLYPQVCDDGSEWAYCTYPGGDVIVWNLDFDGTRESRAFPPVQTRGYKFRVLVGSTGTAGDETLSLDAMRHRRVDMP